MNQKVFVNRTLNMRKIKWIGLDMDHTLVRYHSHAFELLAHQTMLQKLVGKKGYPEQVLKFPFNYDLAIRGLVIDKKKGNLLKVSRHGAIRASFHGTKVIEFPVQQKLYKSIYIDLSDQVSYSSIDTAFSISVATLFAQLVDFKDSPEGATLPDYETIAVDVVQTLDESHRDGSLKDEVARNLDRYIIKDPSVVAGLERYLKHDKKFFILTNSDFHYSKLLLDYAINPFLKDGRTWQDLFEVVVTFSQKPRFFYDNLRFLKVDPTTGAMTNFDEKLKKGIYQGGCADKFTKDLGVEGDDILYIGDHIYGDILRLKKDCNWRTALVLEELDEEIERHKEAQPHHNEIADLMEKKQPLENKLVDVISEKVETGKEADEKVISDIQSQITDIDKRISALIKKQQASFNPHWGEVMRAGNEESYFAHQVDRFACVYMAKLSDLFEYSPRTYFRASRRPLAHEIALHLELGS
ncbi:MAG: HAD-IG family 5'-nucleotidase [Bdellovibrionaceae bacterium]|nr:HAD-IG family 5'-nucleotidase [Pseudobdellovibrionaceae bacterium]